MIRLEEVQELLARRQRQVLQVPGKARAAVLVPLFQKEEALHLLFTLRTELVKYHKGQISFPGGAQDEEESLLDTALREAWEEVGLRAADVTILGEMDDLVTSTSNFLVTPFVSLIPYPYPFKPHPREVAELLEVPLEALLEQRLQDDGAVTDPFGSRPAYKYRDHVIWGVTARMLEQFLDLLSSSPLEAKP